MTEETSAPEPAAGPWDDLIKALTLIRTRVVNSEQDYPLHCEHDELWIMADASLFTPAEIAQLDEWGVFVDSEGGFRSYRFGSA